MKVLGITGSLRKESYNLKLLNYASQYVKQQGADFERFNLIDIPLFNEDVEKQGLPDAVKAFRDKLEQADALLICTPEYNNSISGVLKNSIDWASRSPNRLDGKVAAIMGATVGNFGTVLAQAHLRQILLILNVTLVPYPFVYIPKAQDAFDAQGNLTNQTAAKNVDTLVTRLIDTTRKLKDSPAAS